MSKQRKRRSEGPDALHDLFDLLCPAGVVREDRDIVDFLLDYRELVENIAPDDLPLFDEGRRRYAEALIERERERAAATRKMLDDLYGPEGHRPVTDPALCRPPDEEPDTRAALGG